MIDPDFDFGFTAVDSDELGQLVAPLVSSAPVVSAISEETATAITKKITDLSTQIAALKPASALQIGRVEEKLDRILGMELQELNSVIAEQGNSLGAILNEVEERTTAMQEECKTKMLEVERLILPLLQNLMKNPEKEYIHWPARTTKIQAQIDKITAKTRSYGV